MPLNVRRFCTSILLVFVSFVLAAQAQSVPPANPAQTAPVIPTSGDIMRDRISKAKAFIVVRNYNAAIYELENIRRETADPAVQAVVNVLLMNSYLEQGDFKRAQDFLNEAYTGQKMTKPGALQTYTAVAGEVIKGARNRAERYRSLGLSLSDRTLPLEASNDLEKMRETLEIVITQSKEIAKDTKKTSNAMILVEEASTSRSMIGRDDYDARRWKDGVADAREEIANSRSKIVSAVSDLPASTPTENVVASNNGNAVSVPAPSPPVVDKKPEGTRDREVKGIADSVTKTEVPIRVPTPTQSVKDAPKAAQEVVKSVPAQTVTAVADTGPLDVGSLIAYATRQAPPVYPQAAKSTRTTGVVKVELTIDEKGDVAMVQRTSGPLMLQEAARDAVRKWKFRPFVRGGQPVKAVGFISFNFAL
ncbi:MAG: TonB family protein [Acidobacteriota bacterium]